MLLVLPEEVRLICVLQTYFVILIPLELNMSVIYLHTISEQITYCYSANSGASEESYPNHAGMSVIAVYSFLTKIPF